MPIAPFPSPGGGTTVTDTLRVQPPGAVLDPLQTFVPGDAVALVYVAGTPTLRLCGALTAQRPDLFFGFLDVVGVLPGSSIVITGRGSKVIPSTVAPLTINADVYLSTTAGKVTSTAPIVSGTTSIRVGFAASTTEMFLTTDPRYVFP